MDAIAYIHSPVQCVCRKGVAYVSPSGFVDGLVYITFVEDRRTLAVGDTFPLSRA